VPRSLARFLPLFVIAGAIAAAFALGLDRYLRFEALAENRARLAAFVEANFLLAALAYVGAYALVVALSLPGGAVMTLGGGFLFGALVGGALAVLGATLGATALFLAARTAVGDALRAKAGARIAAFADGFARNAFSYLLFLRLVPVFPFWLVNLVPAFFGVKLSTYVAATLLGILPGTFVFASVGNGLGAVIDAGRTPDLGVIFQPAVLLPLLGLAVLSLVPVILKRRKGPAADG
jgi:uncharacterized membrane protein YdjX (TVP38/TMEM64 family)